MHCHDFILPRPETGNHFLTALLIDGAEITVLLGLRTGTCLHAREIVTVLKEMMLYIPVQAWLMVHSC